MIITPELILLLIIGSIFFIFGIWGLKRHKKFMGGAVEVNGVSLGSIRVDVPGEVKTFYSQKIFYECPFTNERRFVTSDIASTTPKSNEGKQVKLYVIIAPPHKAKFKASSLLVISIASLAAGCSWLFLAFSYATKQI
jgi:hypothetical protein